MQQFVQAADFFGPIFSTVLPFLFVLTVVVFFHELGHFLVARWAGVRVTDFSIGFGPEIAGFYDRHGTRWRFAWIPLGGYVKFIDDENAASVPNADAAKRMSPEEIAGSFHAKPLAHRAAVVAAGPFANFLLAIVLFAGIFTLYGEQVIEPRVGLVKAGSEAERAGLRKDDFIRRIDGVDVESFSDVSRIIGISGDKQLLVELVRDGVELSLAVTPQQREIHQQGHKMNIGWLDIEPDNGEARALTVVAGSAADRAGFQKNDLVVSIDGKAIGSFNELKNVVSDNPGRRLSFTIKRGESRLDLDVTPAMVEGTDLFGEKKKIGQLGVQGGTGGTWKRRDPLSALWKGVEETWFIIDRTMSYLGAIFAGRESADQLGGPLRIAQVSGQAASIGFPSLINLIAVISVSIGLINLFPIPMLDGGHLLFYAIEAIKGEPLSETIREYGFRIGLALVLMLMIFATMNDLFHFKVL